MERRLHAPARLLQVLLGLLPMVAGADFDVDVSRGYDSRNGDVAYNSTDDEFLLVWAVRRVSPVSGGLTAEVSVHALAEAPQTSRGQRFKAGTAVTYNETARRYLVAWADSGLTYAHRLTSGVALSGSCLNLSQSIGNPSAASAVGDARDVVIAGRYLPLGYFLEAVYVGDAIVAYGRLVAPRSQPVAEGAAAFSPVSRQFLYSWQEDELDFIGYGNVRGSTAGLLP